MKKRFCLKTVALATVLMLTGCVSSENMDNSENSVTTTPCIVSETELVTEAEISQTFANDKGIGNSDPQQSIYHIDCDVSEISPYDINSSISYAEVDYDNENFASIDGIVYSKDLKTLIWCPQNYNENKVIIPYGTEIIGNYAFFSCRNISEIEMPDSVLEIGDNAFSYCTMKKIRISDNLKSVGNEAFLCCENLLEIILPDTASYSNGNYHTSWAYGVFKDCSSLETIRIPCNDVAACTDGPSDYPMFENSFSGCLNLKQFILSNNADNLTIYCDALATKSLSIICRMLPKSEMTSFAIPSNTEVLGEYTFEGCLNLKELIIQPYSGDNERKFQINGMSTILGCENLEKLVILEDIRIANIRPGDFPLLTIYTMKGSEADKYAKENGIPVIYINSYNEYSEIKNDVNTTDISVTEKNETVSDVLYEKVSSLKCFSSIERFCDNVDVSQNGMNADEVIKLLTDKNIVCYYTFNSDVMFNDYQKYDDNGYGEIRHYLFSSYSELEKFVYSTYEKNYAEILLSKLYGPPETLFKGDDSVLLYNPSVQGINVLVGEVFSPYECEITDIADIRIDFNIRFLENDKLMFSSVAVLEDGEWRLREMFPNIQNRG